MNSTLEVGSLVGVHMKFHTHNQYALGIVRAPSETKRQMYVELIPSTGVTGNRDIKGDEEVLFLGFVLEDPESALQKVVATLLFWNRDLREKLVEIRKIAGVDGA